MLRGEEVTGGKVGVVGKRRGMEGKSSKEVRMSNGGKAEERK